MASVCFFMYKYKYKGQMQTHLPFVLLNGQLNLSNPVTSGSLVPDAVTQKIHMFTASFKGSGSLRQP